MLLFEAKDIVREHLGRTGFPTFLLDQALAQGRMTVEQQGNWYWMRDETFWKTVIDQQYYPIFAGDGPPPLTKVLAFPAGVTTIPSVLAIQSIPIPEFKDVRSCFVKKLTDNQWSPVTTGGVTKEEAELHYSIDDSGEPELIVLDNFNLVIFPPKPDQEYVIKLLHYRWTTNPIGNLMTDELLTNFPYAIIYGALAWAYEIQLKDSQGALYWKTLLGGLPGENGEIGRGGVISSIRRHNYKRELEDKISLVPMTGPYQRVRRLRPNQDIWIGSGR